MKFMKSGQAALATAGSLIIGLSLTACTNNGSIDVLYATTSGDSPGYVTAYAVDRQSGTLSALSTSTYVVGADPVAMVTTPSEKALYVVNHDDSTITAFSIASDGVLKKINSYTTPGTCPTSAAINAAGTFLYVVDTFQPGVSAPSCALATGATPTTGSVVIYPVGTDGSLGTAVSTAVAVGNTPTSIAVLPTGGSLYVVNQGDATISAFNIGSSGALTAVATIAAGTAPASIVIDPTSRYVYVTDPRADQLIAYSVQTSGTLNTLTNNGPYSAGHYPLGIAIDPTGNFLYLTNYNDSTISAYAITLSYGATSPGVPTSVSGSSAVATGTDPTCVLVEPSLGRYLYTANFRDNTISGFKINSHSGALTALQNNRYNIAGGKSQPTCLSAVTHGNHATQSVTQ